MTQGPYVVTVANRKGGVGKTTLTLNLALELRLKHHRSVLVVDTDPQASCVNFAALRPEEAPLLPVVQISAPIVHRQVPVLGAAFDFVVIDAGGRDVDTFTSALKASDEILIPITPSTFDVWSSMETLRQVRRLIAEPEAPRKASIVLTQTSEVEELKKSAEDAVRLLRGVQLPLLETTISQELAWRETVWSGLGVAEFDQGKGPATRELNQLCLELGLIERAATCEAGSPAAP